MRTQKPPSSALSATVALDHLRRIVQALRESSRASERELGLSGAQLFVLQTLEKTSGALSINALAARTRTHQSTVSVVVKRLVEQGLVKSRPAADDRRRLELLLTAEGRSLLRTAPTTAQDRLVTGLSELGTADCAALAASLGKLVRAMGLEESAPSMFFEEAKPERKRASKSRRANAES